MGLLVSGLILAARVFAAHLSPAGVTSGKPQGSPSSQELHIVISMGQTRFISGGHHCLFIPLPRCSSPTMKAHAVVWKMIQLVL